MKIFRRSSIGLGVLMATYLIARAWLNSAYAAAPSEAIWTWFNHLLGGRHPGIASDLELIFILAISFSMSAFAVLFVISLIRRPRF